MTDTAVFMFNQEALTPAPQAAGNKAFLGAKNPEKGAFSEVFNQHVQKADRAAPRAEQAEKPAQTSGKNLPKNGKPAAESGRSEAQARAPRDKEPVKAEHDQTAKTADAQPAETAKTKTAAKPDARHAETTETTAAANAAAASAPVDADAAEADSAATDLTELLGEPVAADAEPAGVEAGAASATMIADQTTAETTLDLNDSLQSMLPAGTETPQDVLPLNGLNMAMDVLNSRTPVTTAPGEGLMQRSALHDDPASLARGQYLSALMGDALPESDAGDAGADLAGRRQGQGASLLNSLFMNRFAHDAFGGMPSASSDAAPALGSEDGADFSTVMNTLRPASTAATTIPVIPVTTHAGHSAWAGAMGERVMWLAQNDMREAQLQLHPKHLGAVDVRISYQNDQVTVSFVTQNAAAKDALDSAMPRLRDMFSDQGLNLGDVNVAHDSNYGQERQQYTGKGSGDASVNFIDADTLMLEGEAPLHRLGQGMLDLYA